ncbi:hypothetical protein GA0115255_112861, partial [Streptomyces sp. Ncost-T6T-2b]
MLPGAESVSVSAAFFSPSHSPNLSLSHHVASIPAMIARMLNGSLSTRLCSSKASARKSNSSGPLFVRMSRSRAARDVSLRSTSSATTAGSASVTAASVTAASGAPPAGGPTRPASGTGRSNSSRSSTVSRASLTSGSPFPMTSRR